MQDVHPCLASGKVTTLLEYRTARGRGATESCGETPGEFDATWADACERAHATRYALVGLHAEGAAERPCIVRRVGRPVLDGANGEELRGLAGTKTRCEARGSTRLMLFGDRGEMMSFTGQITLLDLPYVYHVVILLL